jgi:hypothetical protein
MTLEDIQKYAPERFQDSGQFKGMVKEALHEWLDEKFMALGKFSAGAIAAAALAGITYFIFWSNGWHK